MAKASFLTLPVEIRFIVYEMLFRDSHCNIQIYKRNVQLCRAFSHASPQALLLTCKPISEEVQDVLYHNTTFNIQLHVQHLPLIQQQKHLLSSPHHETRPKYGFLPVLNVPLALQKYLKRILRLELDVWIGDFGKMADMLEQFEVFKAALGCAQPARDFLSLKVKLRLQPRWMSRGPECPTPGEADELVKAVATLGQCVRKMEFELEDGLQDVVSADCVVEALKTEVPPDMMAGKACVC